jgi:hypothetical protein
MRLSSRPDGCVLAQRQQTCNKRLGRDPQRLASCECSWTPDALVNWNLNWKVLKSMCRYRDPAVSPAESHAPAGSSQLDSALSDWAKQVAGCQTHRICCRVATGGSTSHIGFD